MLPIVGAQVQVPEDRGEKPYSGKIVGFGVDVQKNLKGTPYVWVTVKHPSGSEHVWPSNRLGLRVPEFPETPPLKAPRARP